MTTRASKKDLLIVYGLGVIVLSIGALAGLHFHDTGVARAFGVVDAVTMFGFMKIVSEYK